MNITIGKRIQSLRKHHVLSQQTLAEKLGVSRQTIGKWEADLSLPDLEMLIAMAEIFEIPLVELLGIEEKANTSDSISEFYEQIQAVLINLQKDNRTKNVIQIISIVICVISLLLTITMKIQLDQQNEYYASFTPTEQETYTTEVATIPVGDVNQPILEDTYFASIHMDVSNLTKYDLNAWTVNVNYKFTLKEYTPDTKLSISFMNKNNQTFNYDLEKTQENTFRFQHQIPLDNYKEVTLTIDDGNSVRIENIVKTQQCNYLDFALMNQINLYMPLDEKGHLDLDTIVYDPTFETNIYKNRFIGQLKGDLSIKVHSSNDFRYYREIYTSLDEYTIDDIGGNLSVNEPIYVSLEIRIKHPDGSMYKREIGLSTDAYNNPIYSYFIIKDRNEVMPIFQINQRK